MCQSLFDCHLWEVVKLRGKLLLNYSNRIFVNIVKDFLSFKFSSIKSEEFGSFLDIFDAEVIHVHLVEQEAELSFAIRQIFVIFVILDQNQIRFLIPQRASASFLKINEKRSWSVRVTSVVPIVTNIATSWCGIFLSFFLNIWFCIICQNTLECHSICKSE